MSRRRPSPFRLRLVLALALSTVAGPTLGAAPALAAPPALAPSVIGEPPQGGGVVRFPQAVTVSDGGNRVFVGDQYSCVVQAFDRNGRFLFNVGSRATRGEAGRLGVVGGVAVDRSGHLYVLDSENDRVQVFSAADGTPISSFGDASQFNLMSGSPAVGAGISASGITVWQPNPASAPVVYIADEGNDRVDRIVLDLPSMLPAGPQATSDPAIGLEAPQGLTLDASGTRLYVADDVHHRVVLLDAATLAFQAATGSFGTGPGQLQNPYDVAVDSSVPPRLYVADNLNGRVQVFDATTLQFLTTFGSIGYGPGVGNLEIVRAVGALADAPGGGVYVADTANNRIQAFDGSGNVFAAWGLAGRGPGYVTRPRGVTFSPDGGVAVADSFDQRVALFGIDGTYVDQRGLVSSSVGYTVPGSATGQFEQPSDVAYDGSGNLWVADNANDRVVVESGSGAVLATSPAGAFGSPRALSLAPGGGMYVADNATDSVSLMQADGSVSVVRAGLANPAAIASDPAGTPWVGEDHAIRDALTGATIAPPGSAPWDHPAGMAFDSSGTLFVSERRPATPNGARIVRGTPDGAGGYTWDTIAGEGDGPAQVIEPGGLAVNASGTLVVADTGNNRVLRFDPPGTSPSAKSTLSVAIDQMARGTVTSDLPGIACVTDCIQRYGVGRGVTLTAKAKSGSIFRGWGGDCAPAGTAPTCSLGMSADRGVFANFSAAPVAVPAPTQAPLLLKSFTIKPSTLHAARKANRRRGVRSRKATHATVRVALSRPGTLRVRVLVGKPGRKQGSTCRALTRKNRSRKPCTRYVALAGHRSLGAATNRRFTFTTLWNRRGLKPGAYKLSVQATAGTLQLAPVTRSFRVAH